MDNTTAANAETEAQKGAETTFDLSAVLNEGSKFLPDSSNIKKVIYHGASLSLVIEFANGGAYLYKGVPRSVFDEIVVAHSVGSYVSKNIRDKYETEKLKSLEVSENPEQTQA